jgi:hypothetical protein
MAAHRLDLRDRLKPWCRRFDPVPAHLLPHHVDEFRNPTLLWPTIFMAADPVPPARSRFRTAVRRKVVGIRCGTRAAWSPRPRAFPAERAHLMASHDESM